MMGRRRLSIGRSLRRLPICRSLVEPCTGHCRSALSDRSFAHGQYDAFLAFLQADGFELHADREDHADFLPGGSRGVINFTWIFYAMRSLVPVGHFRNISGHLFT